MADSLTMYAPPTGNLSDKGQEADMLYPDDWTVVESGVACRFAPSQQAAAEHQIAGKLQSKAFFRLRKPINSAPPQSSYRIRITHQNGAALTEPIDFEVVTAKKRSFATAWLVDLVEVK